MGKHRQHHGQSRRQQFVAPPPRRRGISPNALIIAGAIVLLAAVVFTGRSRRTPATAADATRLTAGQDASFAVAELDDGIARFYRYVTAAGTEIRFFLMKSSDGVVRAAFDTCDVCYRERRGYRQSGDSMICNNCGRAFASRDINVLQGGCNPAPIERTLQGDRVVLRASALEQGAIYF
jgi:uncharacterized membrane protein